VPPPSGGSSYGGRRGQPGRGAGLPGRPPRQAQPAAGRSAHLRRQAPGPRLRRRGEVAEFAEASIEYYTRLERGSLAGVSVAVLDAVARALQLDEAERAHLLDLALYADVLTPRALPLNLARFLFLDDRSRTSSESSS
jgi:transcriptional regulator with XRE-family HTH domain